MKIFNLLKIRHLTAKNKITFSLWFFVAIFLINQLGYMAQENFNKNIQSDLHHSNIYKNTVSPLSSSMISPQISFNYNGARNLSDLMAISHAIVNNDKDARLINELGANLLRNNIEWFRCARDYGKEAMKYNFSSYDTYYNYLLKVR